MFGCLRAAGAMLLRALGLLCAVVAPAAAQAPSYVTAWGSPGGAAGFAPGSFDTPTGIAVDASGLVYVADFNNNRVQVFDPGGAFLRQWGDFGAGDGEFWCVSPIAVAGGRVYVGDYYQCRIQAFDPAGGYLGQWGSAGSAAGQFFRTTGIAIGEGGRVYVSDWANSRIQVFGPEGGYLSQWGSTGSGPGQFSHVIGIAADPLGDVYATDANNHRVQKFNANGFYLGQWGSAGSGDGQFGDVLLPGLQGIAADASGHIYVVDTGNHRVEMFSADGAYIAQWSGFAGANGAFHSPQGIAVAPDGSVYVADAGNNRVVKFGFGATPARVSSWGRIKTSYR